MNDKDIERIISREFTSNSSQHAITKRKEELRNQQREESVRKSIKFTDDLEKNGRSWTGY